MIGPRSTVGRVLVAALQAAAVIAAGWFLVKTARASWPELSRLRVTVALWPLLAASLLTAATYVYLVAAWVRSLGNWTPPQILPFRAALRVWFLTNLARFIPGTVWQFAGLAAMAAERGLSPVAATGAILVQQLVLLATGILVTLAVAPSLLGAGALWLGAGVLALFLLALWLRPRLPWKPSGRAAVLYVSALTVPWVAYGVAFWLFGRSLLGAEAPGLVLAVGAFTASYVAGIVAVFAPGGLVVREAALVAALAAAVGPDHALLLALGSRLWLVAVELVTAAIVLVIPKP